MAMHAKQYNSLDGCALPCHAASAVEMVSSTTAWRID